MDTHQIKIRQNQRQTKEYERYYKELRSAEIAENENKSQYTLREKKGHREIITTIKISKIILVYNSVTLFNRIEEEEKIPMEWRVTDVKPTHKRGN